MSRVVGASGSAVSALAAAECEITRPLVVGVARRAEHLQVSEGGDALEEGILVAAPVPQLLPHESVCPEGRTERGALDTLRAPALTSEAELGSDWSERGEVTVAACAERARSRRAFSHLHPASRALLLSQAGPHSGRAPTQSSLLPPNPPSTSDPGAPTAPGMCRWRGVLDPLGDHRSACAMSGVFASRALPLEHAVASVGGGGARVARNVKVAEMNVDVPVKRRAVH